MFSREAADRAVKFHTCLKHTKGIWHGVNFYPLGWQEDIIRPIYGTLKPNGYRQYNYVFVEVPKKNGKSELAAATGLYLTCADGEWAAEVFGAASDREQASLVFDVAVDMIDQWPELKKRCRLKISQKRIQYLPTNSYYKVLSSEAFTKHGLNTHGVVFDELHAQPDDQLYKVLTKGSGDARTSPMFFFITTSGDDPARTSIGWKVHEKALKILQGLIVDPRWYCVIYGIGEEDDAGSEENWFKANPSLGVTVKLETVRADWEAAKLDYIDERDFRQLRLDQWVTSRSTRKWLPLSDWDASSGLVIPEKLKRRECYAGIDLSSKIALTSLSLIFPPVPEDDNYYNLSYFWLPEDNLHERIREDDIPYDRWAKEGLIKLTPGNTIDYNFVEKTICDLHDQFKILELGFDPWNAQQSANNLSAKGFTCIEVRQGARTMSPAMKELEVLVRKKIFRHGGNPVLRSHLSNVEAKEDENENIRPIKGKAKERIDGAVAVINAMSLIINHDIKTGSIYDTDERADGILSLEL